MLGSFTAVTGQVRVHTSGDDPARLVLPSASWRVRRRYPYMLRVHDVAPALSGIRDARRRGPARSRSPGTGWGRPTATTGCGRSTAARRASRRPATDAPAPVFDVRGLALACAGAQSCANLRLAGLLTGPDDPRRHVRRAAGRPAAAHPRLLLSGDVRLGEVERDVAPRPRSGRRCAGSPAGCPPGARRGRSAGSPGPRGAACCPARRRTRRRRSCRSCRSTRAWPFSPTTRVGPTCTCRCPPSDQVGAAAVERLRAEVGVVDEDRGDPLLGVAGRVGDPGRPPPRS